MKKILVAAAVAACMSGAYAAEDINVDVAVIGAGGAGLSAAVEATDLGAKVVVLEKMPMVGGNTTAPRAASMPPARRSRPPRAARLRRIPSKSCTSTR